MSGIVTHIELLNENAVIALARSYKVLDYTSNLRRLLSAIIPDRNFDSFTKIQLHESINTILANRYRGEVGLKAKLVEMFIHKNVTAAFETRVNTSRVDFITVNGETQSYEVKSPIDNLKKLEKQVGDYEKVFEFNYVVIDEVHLRSVKGVIPPHYGIYVSSGDAMTRFKAAKRNLSLNPERQLNLFTKRELQSQFGQANSTSAVVLKKYSREQINESFIKMLTARYHKKWSFLKQNFSQIFPVDYQYFFHHNISPKIIYND